MNFYWEYLVKILPVWLAPNLITVIGLLFMFLITAWNFINVFNEKESTKFEIFMIVFSIFFYQTMDAIDGK